MTQVTTQQIITTKKGTDIEFDNEAWCVENNSDDIRGGFLMWSDVTGKFLLFFNGKAICATTSPSQAHKRLEAIMAKWNCKVII